MNKSAILAGLVATVLLTGTVLTPTSAIDKPAKATTFKVNTEKSVLSWEAKKVTGQHNGSVQFKDGVLTVDGGKLTGGMFSIDMASMTSLDLTDKGMNDKLMGHLKSEDFFNITKFPTSTFKITKVTPGAGANQYTITGDMTIKGITNAVSFPATVKMNGSQIEAEGKATLDRTKYDIRYRSKSFFENLGDKAIYDEFVIGLKLVAGK
jgi:polyisoprenoid-binding protein YceI